LYTDSRGAMLLEYGSYALCYLNLAEDIIKVMNLDPILAIYYTIHSIYVVICNKISILKSKPPISSIRKLPTTPLSQTLLTPNRRRIHHDNNHKRADNQSSSRNCQKENRPPTRRKLPLKQTILALIVSVQSDQ